MLLKSFRKFAFLFFLFLFDLRAERWRTQSELDQFLLLDGLLNQFSDRYVVEVVDDFETNLYEFFDLPTNPNSLRLVYKTPRDSPYNEQVRIFDLETVLLSGWGNLREFQKSLSIQYYVEVGNRNHFRFLRKESKKIPYRPFKYVIWIYSKESYHKLFLIFKIKGRERLLPIATLDWRGWKRIEGIFPKDFYSQPKLNKSFGYSEFLGFSIHTSSKDDKGFYEVLLDHFYLVLDKSSVLYPGAEILDEF
ncbi:MAG: hypothetical protein NZ853_05660 [Leptospiraceae bacterium]|nr:hypothetical protein [Leptospiraceae bacterium]MDW7976565.1 hypothetical protein [Leptospiraceae bacterium]